MAAPDISVKAVFEMLKQSGWTKEQILEELDSVLDLPQGNVIPQPAFLRTPPPKLVFGFFSMFYF